MQTQCSTAGDAREVGDALQPGAKAGPWIVEREIGRGGMGTVYAVVHDAIGKRAALKVVQRWVLTVFDRARTLDEARVVNQVRHPNIIDIFETGTLPDGRPYLVMERLDGQPLTRFAGAGKIRPDRVIAIVLQICDALIAAHAAGVIHRDLKLDNIFLAETPGDPKTPRVKVLDWGVAKRIDDVVDRTSENQVIGTPRYLAPEQARSANVSRETDVYSLGVMAYELFLQHPPFEAETADEVIAMHLRAKPPRASERWPDVPPELERLLDAMLAKSPDHRPTMREVAVRLEAILETFRGRTPSRTRSATDPPGMPRWRWVVGVAAIAACGALWLIGRSGDTAAATPNEAVKPAPAPERFAIEPPGFGVAPCAIRGSVDHSVAGDARPSPRRTPTRSSAAARD